MLSQAALLGIAGTRTPEQKAALRWLLRQLHRAYPRALIVGHHDLNPRRSRGQGIDPFTKVLWACPPDFLLQR